MGTYEVLEKKDRRINDNQFKALMNQFDMIDEQIKFLQDSKTASVEAHGISIQAYHQRKKRMEK